MIDFNIRPTSSFSFQDALFYGKKARLRTMGLLFSDLSLTTTQVSFLKNKIQELALYYDLNVRIGFHIDKVPPALIPSYTEEAKGKGYDYVALAGEALTTDFLPGTNLAGIEAGVDIILHPGLLDPYLAAYVKEKNIFLEFNTHPYYSHGNPLLVKYAQKLQIPLVWGGSITSIGDFEHLSRRSFFPQICPNTDPKLLIKKINEDTLFFINNLKA